MFICAIHKSFVDLREDDDDFAFFVVWDCVIVGNLLIELKETFNKASRVSKAGNAPES